MINDIDEAERKLFEKAWTATGYNYGEDEKEAVRLGWQLARAALVAPQQETVAWICENTDGRKKLFDGPPAIAAAVNGWKISELVRKEPKSMPPPAAPVLIDEEIGAWFADWFGKFPHDHEQSFTEERIKEAARALLAKVQP